MRNDSKSHREDFIGEMLESITYPVTPLSEPDETIPSFISCNFHIRWTHAQRKNTFSHGAIISWRCCGGGRFEKIKQPTHVMGGWPIVFNDQVEVGILDVWSMNEWWTSWGLHLSRESFLLAGEEDDFQFSSLSSTLRVTILPNFARLYKDETGKMATIRQFRHPDTPQPITKHAHRKLNFKFKANLTLLPKCC